MNKGIFEIKKRLTLVSLHIEIAWLRLKVWRVEMLKRKFAIYDY